MVDDGRFVDRTVLVTGSTRGIGAAIARRFAREGASVMVSGRSTEDGEAIVRSIENEGGNASFLRMDVRVPEDIEAGIRGTMDRFGGLDVLVNNAAVETDTSVAETSMEEWNRVVETDFRSYWLCVRKAVLGGDLDVIVNVSSNHAHHTMPGKFPYNAVKAGIEGMTRAMALDLGPTTRVVSVTPGWIEIERTTAKMDEETRATLEGIHPTGRLGRPEDVAAAVAYLSSDEGGFITGTSLVVDGGRSAVMQDDTLPNYVALKDK